MTRDWAKAPHGYDAVWADKFRTLRFEVVVGELQLQSFSGVAHRRRSGQEFPSAYDSPVNYLN